MFKVNNENTMDFCNHAVFPQDQNSKQIFKYLENKKIFLGEMRSNFSSLVNGF